MKNLILTFLLLALSQWAIAGPCDELKVALPGVYKAEEKGLEETSLSYYMILKDGSTIFRVYGVQLSDNGQFELIAKDKTLNGDPIMVQVKPATVEISSEPVELNSAEEAEVAKGERSLPEVTTRREYKCTIAGVGSTDFAAVVHKVRLQKGDATKIRYAILKNYEMGSTTVFRRLRESEIDSLKSKTEIQDILSQVKGSL